jgi:A/G-specific adenine glycosylase
VQNYCESFKRDIVSSRPAQRKRKQIIPLQVTVGVLVQNDRIFIQKRAENGLMAGLWEFPGGKVEQSETPEEALVREFSEELRLDVHLLDKITLIRHSYTSFRVSLHAFFCQMIDPGQQPVLRSAVDACWATREQLEQFAFPAANRKLIELL